MGEKFVSIIVPCFNEERHIAECLDSILANNYPAGKAEILVVDGMSKDRTREIIQRYSIPNTQYSIRLLDNPKVITPAAMNIGIQAAKGDVIIKMDAHCVYAKDYISKCVRHLRESNADNVGGVLKAVPPKNTLMAKAIALSLSHVFGVGGSYFRTGADQPREVDTVAFGCYRREVFEKIGPYDERMEKTEDLELNYRLGKAGGRIMLFPDIKAVYYPSSDTLGSFFRHNFTDGIWATYPLKYGFKVSLRHLIPLIFVLTLPVSIWLYIPVSLFFSLKIAIVENNVALFLVLPFVFAARHIGYGLGSLVGLAKIIL
ncbi:MAG: hypothetical protein A3J30_04625 [Candidatus Wildermuthbacteria bacterium RIFCSPLOWO2_02_FULL_47_9c]|uniref:Glycosyl transferase n=2 Tax=Parcubacteria group TaxID=1794811 RepID=A0A837INQ5_9BACT|nr:MAG: Glycosyl transferase [Candidatus Yanofskybacteria bacterium GW2011_GWC1_48_11]KKW04107.1 MAG: Glycosyl transferase [Parcubacteria group bacterium GW2011_GWB1_49_12]KKW08382.1 MAG: Glycosyl transferase [Parcubacteria group bacterium GW2011_GWA1_49_26]KKW14311.1 MAG: Glycosyl transferase [Parcubacteria group bacterium GW2011_GWA2_50_10]OHA61155.1 MAG: hypothetical protein A2109_01435 [Candidatus Wildermuthbacteria bacterium GWA1_49_26]OHA65548.1 MAG: hypothetical protein A2674_02920 [Can